jgi:hypothetical protein
MAIVLVMQRQIIGIGVITVLIAYPSETITSVTDNVLKSNLPIIATEVMIHARAKFRPG